MPDHSPTPFDTLCSSPRFQTMTVADAIAELRANGCAPPAPNAQPTAPAPAALTTEARARIHRRPRRPRAGARRGWGRRSRFPAWSGDRCWPGCGSCLAEIRYWFAQAKIAENRNANTRGRDDHPDALRARFCYLRARLAAHSPDHDTF